MLRSIRALPFATRSPSRRASTQARDFAVSLVEKVELEADSRGRPILTAGSMRIVIDPRAVRLFDAIHLYVDGVEVWLPILARLRLRSAVRWFVLRHAAENFAEVEARRTRSTRTRKRSRQEQSS